MSEPYCCDCKYFESDDMKRRRPSFFGSCHRHAPVPCTRVNRNHLFRIAYWPLVSLNDWCGNFEPRSRHKTCNACLRKAAS
jgi:hypothetical protein